MIGSNMRETVIRAGAVIFASEQRFGFTIPPGGFTGWTDPVSPRLQDVPRLSAHGSHALKQWMGTRLVSISGTCYAQDPHELEHYGDRLSALGSDGSAFDFHVQHAGRTLHAEGFRAPGVRFEPYPGLNRAQYQFDIWCPDPRKYGEERQFTSTGGGVYAYQYGNTDAWPTFEITGFAGGYRIEGLGPNQGRAYTVVSKPSGAVDRIDFRTGMITRNGDPTERITSQRHVWPVAPNGVTPWRIVPLSGGSGSARMSLLDTWL